MLTRRDTMPAAWGGCIRQLAPLSIGTVRPSGQRNVREGVTIDASIRPDVKVSVTRRAPRDGARRRTRRGKRMADHPRTGWPLQGGHPPFIIARG